MLTKACQIRREYRRLRGLNAGAPMFGRFEAFGLAIYNIESGRSVT